MIKKIKQKVYQIVIEPNFGCSPTKIATSLSVGVYIAFCPFIGFHTVLVILFSWLLGLNWPLVFAFSNLINNPWTMVPVYALDYFVGTLIFKTISVDATLYNPSWVSWLNEYIQRYIAIPDFSFWTFMVGGHFLGIALAIVLYPIFKMIFVRFTACRLARK